MALTTTHRSPRSVYNEDVRDDAAVDEPVDTGASYGATVLSRIIWFAAGVIEAILALRFIFALLGANPANAFANFIYTISHPFVAPFFGLFRYNGYTYGFSRFEVFTLVAMLFYALIAWGLSYLATIGRRY